MMSSAVCHPRATQRQVSLYACVRGLVLASHFLSGADRFESIRSVIRALASDDIAMYGMFSVFACQCLFKQAKEVPIPRSA